MAHNIWVTIFAKADQENKNFEKCLIMGEWAHGLMGCCDDIGTCLISWVVPCLSFGQNAEAAGTASSCLIGGVLFLIPLVNIVCWIKTRGAIREKYGIEGSVVNDIFAICC